MHILALSGSLRKDSAHRRLLETVAEVLPPDTTLELYDYADLPLFNADLGTPAAATRLRQAIANADAVLIATPEFNHSVPGVLKNVIDWASRPAFQSALAHKPTGMFTASPGPVGGARAQAHLKTILDSTLTPVLPYRELTIGGVNTLFGESGRLEDEATRRRIQRYVAALVDWAEDRADR